MSKRLHNTSAGSKGTFAQFVRTQSLTNQNDESKQVNLQISGESVDKVKHRNERRVYSFGKGRRSSHCQTEEEFSRNSKKQATYTQYIDVNPRSEEEGVKHTEILTVRPDSVVSTRKENEDLRNLVMPGRLSIRESGVYPKSPTSYYLNMGQPSEKVPSSKFSDFINNIAPGIQIKSVKPQQTQNKKPKAQFNKPQQVNYKQLIPTEIRFKPADQKILRDFIMPTISGYTESSVEVVDFSKMIRDDAQASYNPTFKESPTFAPLKTEKFQILDRSQSSDDQDIPKQIIAIQKLVLDKNLKLQNKQESIAHDSRHDQSRVLQARNISINLHQVQETNLNVKTEKKSLRKQQPLKQVQQRPKVNEKNRISKQFEAANQLVSGKGVRRDVRRTSLSAEILSSDYSEPTIMHVPSTLHLNGANRVGSSQPLSQRENSDATLKVLTPTLRSKEKIIGPVFSEKSSLELAAQSNQVLKVPKSSNDALSQKSKQSKNREEIRIINLKKEIIVFASKSPQKLSVNSLKGAQNRSISRLIKKQSQKSSNTDEKSLVSMKDLLQVEMFQEELSKVMMSPNYQELMINQNLVTQPIQIAIDTSTSQSISSGFRLANQMMDGRYQSPFHKQDKMIEGIFGKSYHPDKVRPSTEDYLKIINQKLDDNTIQEIKNQYRSRQEPTITKTISIEQLEQIQKQAGNLFILPQQEVISNRKHTQRDQTNTSNFTANKSKKSFRHINQVGKSIKASNPSITNQSQILKSKVDTIISHQSIDKKPKPTILNKTKEILTQEDQTQKIKKSISSTHQRNFNSFNSGSKSVKQMKKSSKINKDQLNTELGFVDFPTDIAAAKDFRASMDEEQLSKEQTSQSQTSTLHKPPRNKIFSKNSESTDNYLQNKKKSDNIDIEDMIYLEGFDQKPVSDNATNKELAINTKDESTVYNPDDTNRLSVHKILENPNVRVISNPLKFQNKNLIFRQSKDGNFYNVKGVQLGKPQVPQQYLRLISNMRAASESEQRRKQAQSHVHFRTDYPETGRSNRTNSQGIRQVVIAERQPSAVSTTDELLSEPQLPSKLQRENLRVLQQNKIKQMLIKTAMGEGKKRNRKDIHQSQVPYENWNIQSAVPFQTTFQTQNDLPTQDLSNLSKKERHFIKRERMTQQNLASIVIGCKVPQFRDQCDQTQLIPALPQVIQKDLHYNIKTKPQSVLAQRQPDQAIKYFSEYSSQNRVDPKNNYTVFMGQKQSQKSSSSNSQLEKHSPQRMRFQSQTDILATAKMRSNVSTLRKESSKKENRFTNSNQYQTAVHVRPNFKNNLPHPQTAPSIHQSYHLPFNRQLLVQTQNNRELVSQESNQKGQSSLMGLTEIQDKYSQLKQPNHEMKTFLQPLPQCEFVKSWQYKLYENAPTRHQKFIMELQSQQDLPRSVQSVQTPYEGRDQVVLAPKKSQDWSEMALVPYVDPLVKQMVHPKTADMKDRRNIFKQKWHHQLKKGNFLAQLCREVYFVQEQAPQFDFLSAPITKVAYNSSIPQNNLNTSTKVDLDRMRRMKEASKIQKIVQSTNNGSILKNLKIGKQPKSYSLSNLAIQNSQCTASQLDPIQHQHYESVSTPQQYVLPAQIEHTALSAITT